MLLCVAGGGSSGFSRDRSREGSHCSAQSAFTKNNAKQQVMVDERCSMTSTAVNVPQDLARAQESLCLDLRTSRNIHNKPNESSLSVRGKVIVVRGDDIVCESTENDETCATTTTFKSNIVNGKRSTNTILVRYKSSKSLAQSSDICQNESLGRNEGFQEYHKSVSAPSSTTSSENSTSSQNDKISTSAWAQIMELEGYRSPAIGLDKLPDKDNDDISEAESTDVFTPVHTESFKCYSGDNVCDNAGEVIFPKNSYNYVNSSAHRTIESNSLSSVALNKDLDHSIVQYNSPFPVDSHAPESSFTTYSDINHHKNKSNWQILKAELCDRADSSYGNSSSASSSCNDKISEDSLTLHCSLPNEKSCIRTAQKVKSPMYRSESSRVTKVTPFEKNKSRRKTLPDGNLHFSNGNSQEIKCANKKQISTDVDPNASWGRYNAKAMRESVRKVAQKYSETAYLKRQAHSKFDAISDVKGVQLTKFVSPYNCQDHLHSSTTNQYHQNNLFCSRVPSIPSHLHHVAPEIDSILSTRHNLHLIAPTSTHHDHDISIKEYLMNFSRKKRDGIEHVMTLNHNPYVHSDKTFVENESTRSVNSQVNNGLKHSSQFNCDISRSANAYSFNYPMCENCSKSKMCADSYESPNCVNFVQNEDLSVRSSDTVDKLYSSVHIHDIKSKLCSDCAQAAEYGPPSKHSASRAKCHKTRNSQLNSSNLSSPLSLSKKSSSDINNTYSNLSDHSLYLSKDDFKSNSVKCGTLLTAREMSDLVHGNNLEKSADNRIPLSGVTSKVTNWIQKQRDKRKPVFFIGDAPTYLSSNYEEGDTPNRVLTRKSKRSLSLSSVREDEISSNCKSFTESSLNLSEVRLNPSACDDRDYEHKHLYIKRASSCCSNRGSIRRKIRQGSPVREEKESVAKNLNDPRNQVDGCIASGSKCQNYRVKNKHSLDNDPDKKEDANFKQESLSTLNSQCALPVHEYSLDEINQSKNKFISDINVKTECLEQKHRENEKLSNSACKNTESLNEVKGERSSFSKRLLNIKQLTRALSLHSLKKKNKESTCESPSNKARAEEPAISTHFSKWYRNSKRKRNDSKYGSLRKSMSYCELTVREATTSSKSISQINAYTEIKRDPKSSARTSVPFMNYVCCSATIRRSVSLYWKFPLSRCLEYSVEETKSDFLARLCFSRLYSRNRAPFIRQLKNRNSVAKMKDSDNSRTTDERNIHVMDTPLHDQCNRIPVIILPNFTGSDANILRKRAASTSDYSPKSKAIQRPMSVADYLTLDNTPCTKVPDGQNDLTTASDTTSSEEQQKNLTSLDQIWRANPVKLCRVHSRLLMCRHKGRYRLRRSISQPVELEMTGSVHNLRDSTHGSSDHEHFQKGSLSSDDEASSESDIYHSYCCSPTRRSNTCWELSGDGTMYAEALWDHETIDPEELPFLAGDIIEVTDTSDQDWWWGTKDGHGGWFPSAFVRLYVSHRTPSLHYNGQQSDRIQIPYSPCKVSMNNLSCEQVRANIVQEIVATERDYVKHLKDVVEGYLKQVHRRPDMFSKERIETVFGNIKEIYTFQSQFLKQLEECLDKDAPNLSQIGNCFLNHKEEFKMYSQYCNNHPLAVSELQELYCDSQYIHFFEACRLLQEMIDISLDGFLLTPIQRICKYPLQLAELLKFTDVNHPDHVPVTNALAAMKEVAELVNERKRRMECLERIAEWQSTIEGWEGPDVLDTSSILIHCGEVTRVSSSWSRDIYLFIFDHQLIYCKKDLLKRHTYAYKGRLNLDHCDIVDIEDGKDSQFAVNVKNAWKIYCKDKDKWYLFYAKTSPEKDQWLCAFKAERQRVIDDEKQAFVVTEEAKKSARLAVHNKQKPKRPRAKFTKGRRCHPDVAVTELLLDSPSAKARSGSLPSNIHPELAIMTGAKLGPTRKKGSGWFHFGSGKKPKS